MQHRSMTHPTCWCGVLSSLPSFFRVCTSPPTVLYPSRRDILSLPLFFFFAARLFVVITADGPGRKMVTPTHFNNWTYKEFFYRLFLHVVVAENSRENTQDDDFMQNSCKRKCEFDSRRKKKNIKDGNFLTLLRSCSTEHCNLHLLLGLVTWRRIDKGLLVRFDLLENDFFTQQIILFFTMHNQRVPFFLLQ